MIAKILSRCRFTFTKSSPASGSISATPRVGQRLETDKGEAEVIAIYPPIEPTDLRLVVFSPKDGQTFARFVSPLGKVYELHID